MRVVLASVLKSAEDVRLYHKIAHSILAQVPSAEIEVWGQSSASLPTTGRQGIKPSSDIKSNELFNFSRLSFSRIWANLTFFLALWRAKPDIVVVATFELLPAGVLYKWCFGGKLGYDVQENYGYNVRYTQVFPRLLRVVLAFGIRCIERLAMPWIDFCWVAERCYLTEMPFLQKKAIFLPNKVSRKATENLPAPTLPAPFTFLYSGNISASYGVFEAIEWVARLNLPACSLKIIGHCPQIKDKIKIETWAKTHTFLVLHISEKPIPHHEILQAMQEANWLLMPYQVNKSVAERIPTKFYEALALGKNMIVTKHTAWQTFMAQYPEAVVLWIDFQAQTPFDTKKITDTNARYKRYEKDVFWEFDFYSHFNMSFFKI